MSNMTADDIYGGPRIVGLPAAAPASTAPRSDAPDSDDAHDKSDKGPGSWWDDPVLWLVLVAAIATGALGIRFKWWGSGAEVGARVNLGDELATLFGVTLYSITGIVLFKVAASKVEVPGLQKLAAAI